MSIVVVSGVAGASLAPSRVGVDKFVVILRPLERSESRTAIRDVVWAAWCDCSASWMSSSSCVVYSRE